MNTAGVLHAEIDGQPATVDQLLLPATVNYGHVTTMQVRNRRVRGLAAHLDRLDTANRELFGTGLDGDLVRRRVRHALAARHDATVRVSAFQPEDAPTSSLLVTVRPPADPPSAPRRLRSVRYQRPLPHLKHVGTFAQLHHGRQARQDGFDDALLVGQDDLVTEGTVSNIGFLDGPEVRWPQAPALAGVTEGLLVTGLTARGVPQHRRPVRLGDLPGLSAAFLTNSRGVSPVGRIDDHHFPVDGELMGTLHHIYASVPWDRL
ncbi:aminotransferase class IV family protein [Actinoalloteichus sp. AHMU CJ021]|uniref:aminotransferase class IV family protein n=1 Tax=Actinoalloteichus sp. AHMU CJ021 TaxID=2072503 RepID=UPI00307C0116